MLNPADIKRHFEDRYHEDELHRAIGPVDFNQLHQRLFFLTFKFPAPVSAASVISITRRFFYGLSRNLLGNRFRGKKHQRPMTYAFTDFEGTRHRGTANPRASISPHVHAITYVRTELLEKFISQIHLHAKQSGLPITDLDVKRCDPKDGPIEHVISYAKKGFDRVPDTDAMKQDLWTVI